MKDKGKTFGIISVIVTIGLLLIGCEDKGPAYIRVVNQNDKPITSVWTGGRTSQSFGEWMDNVNITKGNTQTFTTSDVYNGVMDTVVYVAFGTGLYDSVGKEITLVGGETITVTFTENDELK